MCSVRYGGRFFFFKQKTAYEMRISDWSSDVCSSDLPELIKEASGAYENWSSIVKVLGFADPELISTFAENAGPAIAWLKSFGVRFDFLPGYFITTCTSRMGDRKSTRLNSSH